MKKTRQSIWCCISAVLAAIVGFAGTAQASVSVSKIFNNNMILQRGKPVPVWGSAAAGERVTVTFSGQSKSATADSLGKWRVDLDAMPADTTGQTLTISAANTLNFSNVVVGDVWLCGGQSNMATALGGYAQPGDIENADYPGIRRLSIPAANAEEPVTASTTAVWTVCTPTTAGGMSATAFYFARKLYLELNRAVPIGVIVIAVGGTCIDPYVGPEGCLDIPTLYPLYGQEIYPKGPFCRFNAMVYPNTPFGAKGMIWYQGENGESSIQSPDSYYLKLKALSQSWKSINEIDDMPFYVVQIANYGTTPTGPAPVLNPGGGWAADTRLQQGNALGLPHAGVATAIDVGETDQMHPVDKMDVGERLALWALKNDYGRSSIVPSGPVLRDANVVGSTVECSFDYAGSGLMVGSKTFFQPTQEVVGGTLQLFSIAGANGVWYWANATISGDKVILSSPSVPSPKMIAYACWQNPLGANLYNRDGLPALPFYVDDVTTKCKVTATAGAGGSISPAGDSYYLRRKTALYTITPDPGYYIQEVAVDGVSTGSSLRYYTFDPLYANHTISATFASTVPAYTITASSAPGGSISPSGTSTVTQGDTRTYKTFPDTGNRVSELMVDGHPVGRRSSFTFRDIRKNHTISVEYVCTITATVGYGGAITPVGITEVAYGGSQVYTIAPNPGFTTTSVKVDGLEQGVITDYTFTNVTGPHTISATFTGGGGTQDGVPRTFDLLLSVNTDSLPASGETGDWATYIPAGKTLAKLQTPTVETIYGAKWEKNVNADADGYDFGTFANPIICNGASVVTVVKPTLIPGNTNNLSCVNIFYDQLVLRMKASTGQVVVTRNAVSNTSTSALADGQPVVLSLVVQPDGKYKVFANGTEILNVTTTSAFTQLLPENLSSTDHNIALGTTFNVSAHTFNGNIGDAFVYLVPLSDTERQQLEAKLTRKFITCTVTASAGDGGAISPSGPVVVNRGSSKSFSVMPSPGCAVHDVLVDGLSVGPRLSYTFDALAADHSISSTFARLYGVTNVSALTDPLLAKKPARVWGRVIEDHRPDSFTVSDGHSVPISVQVNGATLHASFAVGLPVAVTGVLADNGTMLAVTIEAL